MRVLIKMAHEQRRINCRSRWLVVAIFWNDKFTSYEWMVWREPNGALMCFIAFMSSESFVCLFDVWIKPYQLSTYRSWSDSLFVRKALIERSAMNYTSQHQRVDYEDAFSNDFQLIELMALRLMPELYKVPTRHNKHWNKSWPGRESNKR